MTRELVNQLNPTSTQANKRGSPLVRFAVHIKGICTRPELNRREEERKKESPKPIEIQEPSPQISSRSVRARTELSARDGVIVARKHSFVAPNCERTERKGEGSVDHSFKFPPLLHCFEREHPSLAHRPPVNWRSFAPPQLA